MLNLGQLFSVIKEIDKTSRLYIAKNTRPENVLIDNTISDSRMARKGSIFCCFRGERFDGHNFAGVAEQKEASALITEEFLDVGIPQIVVNSVREIAGYAAAAIYSYPSEKLLMVAVTGTNGKSTTSYMIKKLLEEAGYKTGLIGTITYSDGENETGAERTTPEATDIQSLLSRMIHNGCEACVMETSSHGLILGRLNGCSFDVGIFTNLTEEHLDFHGDIEKYFEAKMILFKEKMKKEGKIITNIDDQYGEIIYNSFSDKTTSYALKNRAADYFADNTEVKPDGCIMDIIFKGEILAKKVNIPLTGHYNLYNALAAVSAAMTTGVSPETVSRGLKTLPKVPGRLERYLFSNGVCCFIDYAHTPDALENVLKTLSQMKRGRLKIVFGLGGNRYAPNRPVMGAVAATYADDIFLTMDNPRNEDPEKIAEQIKKGINKKIRSGNTCITVIDRKKAVNRALDSAHEGDIVLVSGKGPEREIIWGERKIPYNDAETVIEWANSHKMECW
jgi:UDP-N-acetylmuramoyl-L-alanyl-D-glutamate--2,6-diaminopimelate ligase